MHEFELSVMKTIGLLGGMSWESTVDYYKNINKMVKERLGGAHSADILLYSFDFHHIETLQHKDNWKGLEQLLVEKALMLENGGAELIAICTNTMHLLADQVQENISIPLVHIVDATGKAIRTQGLGKIALLGTKFTMEKGFYKDRLAEKFGLEVLTPDQQGRDLIHRIIYDELILGEFKTASRQKLVEVIGTLVERGSEGVILGCTELPLLLQQDHLTTPVFDTTLIHSTEIVNRALDS